jgi:hypothetical protein
MMMRCSVNSHHNYKKNETAEKEIIQMRSYLGEMAHKRKFI